MKAQVTFETEYFWAEPGEDEHTNPGRYGRSVATWLAAQLRARGVEVESVCPEDFGRNFVVSHRPFLLWLNCGNIDGSETEWMVYPVAEPSWIQRLFKRVNPEPALEELWRHVRELVPVIPGVRKIVWD